MQPTTIPTPFHIALRDLTRYQRLDAAQVIAAMRMAGADHLVHYAGASHRDQVAWHMCAAWLAQPTDPEHVLKSRALKAAWGWDVAPEAFLSPNESRAGDLIGTQVKSVLDVDIR